MNNPEYILVAHRMVFLLNRRRSHVGIPRFKMNMDMMIRIKVEIDDLDPGSGPEA